MRNRYRDNADNTYLGIIGKLWILIMLPYLATPLLADERIVTNREIDLLPTVSPLLFMDTVKMCNRTFYLTGEFRSGFILGTDRFLRGLNQQRKEIKYSSSVHLKLGFRSASGSWIDRVFDAPYQGIGWGYNLFIDTRELGNPWALYLFQGGRIVTFVPHLSLWYEWNLGISANWNHFEKNTNSYNFVIGSKVNAYMNTSFFLNWNTSSNTDIRIGFAFTHFSNGNSHEPNGGVNIISPLVGVNYYLNKTKEKGASQFTVGKIPYNRRVMYEVLLYGSTVRKKIILSREPLHSYSTENYRVGGGAFSTLYAFNHRVRLGGTLDVSYDESREVKYRLTSDREELIVVNPSRRKQVSVGLAGRIDYVMPYFTISGGVGYDLIHEGRNTKRFYQNVALKISIYKGSFFNIGYRLQNFQNPNFLMLGVGYLFNRDIYPRCH